MYLYTTYEQKDNKTEEAIKQRANTYNAGPLVKAQGAAPRPPGRL